MKNLSLWTVVASLFCTLSVTDACLDAGRSLQLAAMGNPAGVERSLAEAAAGMGIVPRPAVVPPAAKAPVLPISLTPVADQSAAVANWIRSNPSRNIPVTLDGRVAKIFGLSDGADLDAASHNFGNRAKGAGIYFLVFSGRSEVVLVRKDEQLHRLIYWLFKDGAFAAAVLNQGGQLTIVSNQSYYDVGSSIIDYFYSHLIAPGVATADGQTKS